MGASTGTQASILRLRVDRWRLRDAAATIHPDGLDRITLDAHAGMRVPFGVVPVAAGMAYADLACGDHINGSPEEAARSHHRRTRIEVTYGPATAGIGESLVVESELDGAAVHTTVRAAQGVVATVAQSVAPTALPAEPRTVSGSSQDAGVGEYFARVRVARWCYVAGEMCAAHGDHVAATATGLGSVAVPESLLLGLLERHFFAESPVPTGVLTVEFDAALLAGSHAQIQQTPVDDEPGTRAATVTCGNEVVATARLSSVDRSPAALA